MILLNKLLEDGNTLYRRGRHEEAAHRYSYALKRLPPMAEQADPSVLEVEQVREDEKNIFKKDIFQKVFFFFRLTITISSSASSESTCF